MSLNYFKTIIELIKLKISIWKFKRQLKKIKVDKELLLAILHDYIKLAAYSIKNNEFESQNVTLYKNFYTLNVQDELDPSNNILSDITKQELIRLFGYKDILQDYIKLKILMELK